MPVLKKSYRCTKCRARHRFIDPSKPHLCRKCKDSFDYTVELVKVCRCSGLMHPHRYMSLGCAYSHIREEEECHL